MPQTFARCRAPYLSFPALNFFEIAKQVGHFLRARLKLGHGRGLPAGDLADQIDFRFVLRHFTQAGPDLSVCKRCVTPRTVHLKDGGALNGIARQGQYPGDVRIGDLKVANC